MHVSGVQNLHCKPAQKFILPAPLDAANIFLNSWKKKYKTRTAMTRIKSSPTESNMQTRSCALSIYAEHI